jgi:2-oxoglutarate dehydrogenase E1 component
MRPWRDVAGLNWRYVAELYERYRRDPDSVDAPTRAYFHDWRPPLDGTVADRAGLDTIVGAANLAHALRAYGHLAAQIDPLGAPRPGDPLLELAIHGVTEDALRQVPAALVGGPIAERTANALEATQELRRVYMSSTGYDYDHIRDSRERTWLRDAAEAGRFRPPNDPIDEKVVLERLTQVEAFERFLHRVFPGKTRFSVEGVDMLVPMLDVAVRLAAEARMHAVFIGMSHRGRLNVLAHVLQKPYAAILAAFKDPVRSRQFRDDLGWTGDVTYHTGARLAPPGGEATGLSVRLVSNPSHLEAAAPVVLGMARAAGTAADRPGAPHFDPDVVLPVLIHGDAGFPGQGSVAETLNLSRLRGYTTGGTIHVMTNNQLGYTATPEEAYSTTYASDLAKGFEIPVVHVNADVPEACIEAIRLAGAYRREFHKDFLIDLVGYRRYGHNEGDEPTFTQPLMYRTIQAHSTVRELWAQRLAQRHVVAPTWPDDLVRRRMASLQDVLASLRPEVSLDDSPPPLPPSGAARTAHTAVPLERLRHLHRAALQVPRGFALHPKLRRAMERRQAAFDDPDQATVDWAAAEQLAFASVLADGVAIRLTGQDVERGTFSQRHAVFHDTETGAQFVPLQALAEARAPFEVCNSPVTENAALGFEYGYNVEEPGRLVIWEAQYGDFVNGAQVVVDEFIASARAKWSQTPSLVLLLPHGFEGQGPDHSSARPERFLQLAAETNMRIANCTTAAQYFHLLRRQAAVLRTDPLPLIVLTPKSLLRHPRVASRPRDLAEGCWQPVLDDANARRQSDQIRRVIVCSGKVSIDLLESPRRPERVDVAIVRLEQLYPFPATDLENVFNGYPRLNEVVWVQEEPQNMGPGPSVAPALHTLIGARWPLECISRPANPSPAEGSHARHTLTQAALIERAFRMDEPDGRSGALPTQGGAL